MQPDLSGVAALQPLLDKYAAIPSVKALSDGLAAMAARPPQVAQTFQYTQTPASSLSAADKARDQAHVMTIVTWWVPGAMARVGLVAAGARPDRLAPGAAPLGCASARGRSGPGAPDAEPAAEERPDETVPLALVGAVPATQSTSGWTSRRSQPSRGTMNTAASVRIEGDTIVDAFRENLRRLPDRPALRRRVGAGWETLTWADYGTAVQRGHRRARRARDRARRARRDLLQQPGRVARRRLRLARQRQRDRAAVPDQRSRAGGLHPRPRRGPRVLRREPRPARPGSSRSGTSCPSSTASSSSTTASASTIRSSSSFAELRAVGRGPPPARARPVRHPGRRGVGRSGRHPRLHERHDGAAQGGDDHPRQHHVDDPQLRVAVPDPRGRAAPVVPAAEPHRRADDQRLRSRSPSAARRGSLAAWPRSPRTSATAARRCSSPCPGCGRSSRRRSLAKLGDEHGAQEARHRPVPRAGSAHREPRTAPSIARRSGSGCPTGCSTAWSARKIRHELGLDQAHILITAAAPIHPDLIRWFHALGLPIVELYGQTEVVWSDHLQPARGQPDRHRRARRSRGCGCASPTTARSS